MDDAFHDNGAIMDVMTTNDPFHESVDALRATGRPIEPTGDDLGLWLVDGVEMPDSDLLPCATA